MISRLSLLVLLVAAAPFARAVTEATCTDPNITWVYNSGNKLSPCEVAEKMAGLCGGGGLTLPLLESPDSAYYGPLQGQDDQCQCNSVFYSLVSACALCQDRSWISFATFATNCTTYWQGFPTAPSGVEVPAYAWLNIPLNGTFNSTAAEQVAESLDPIVTPSSSQIPKSTDGQASGGLIAGVIVGAVALITLGGVIGLVWYRKKKRVSVLPVSHPRSARKYAEGIETPVPLSPVHQHEPKAHEYGF